MKFSTLMMAAATAAFTSAQNETLPALAAALNTTEELSTLNTVLADYPDILEMLANATNITVFAPNNDAMDELMAMDGFEESTSDPGFLAAVLQYHVVGAMLTSENFTTTPNYVPTLMDNATFANVSAGQRIGILLAEDTPQVLSGPGMAANVVEADIMTTNGVVHIIDSVLSLPVAVSATALGANLTALAGALDLGELTETVDEAEDITIFAPTTDAFEEIASIFEGADASAVADILGYHVVSGQVAYTSTLEDGDELEAMSGDMLNITIIEGDVFVNSARVVVPNVLVANGVIHFIDAVLNANSTNEPEPEAEVGDSPVNFEDAEGGALLFTMDLPTATVTVPVTTTALPTDYSTPVSTVSVTVSGDGAMATGTDGEGDEEGAAPRITGAVAAAALFGGAAALANF